MKRSGVAAFTFGALGAATLGTACADPSVTLFGAVDVAMRSIHYSDYGTANSVGTFGNAPSHFGLRGEEDLGGGLKAIFWLEAAFTPDNGNSATQAFGMPLFNRSSWVGLRGNFGELHVGRDWSPTYVNTYMYDPSYNLGVTNNAHLSNMLNQGIVSNYYWNANSVGYSLPANLGGFYGSVQASAGEGGKGCNGNVACGTTIGGYRGGRFGYAAGAFDISAAVGRTDITATTRASVAGGDWTQANIGASYNFGAAKLLLWYNHEEFVNWKEKRASASVVVPVGDDYMFVTYSSATTDNAAKTAGAFGGKTFGASYVHTLSKRTALYASAAYLSNKGRGTLNVEDVGSYSSNTQPGGKSTGVELGMRHSF